MSGLRRGIALLIVSCLVVGCSGEGGESQATPENPQAALDAVKKLQGAIPNPKEAAKGVAAPIK
jgi:hypothetical protein